MRKHANVFALTTGILAFGSLLAAWLWIQSDEILRAELKEQARQIANAIHVERLQAFSGAESDLKLPEYQRLKKQLTAVCTANSNYRFVYLMGRRSDSTVFYLVDSEPEDSADYSPPGQPYDEADDVEQEVFTAGEAIVDGPATDRWGTWVSPLIPLNDPRTGAVVAVLGIDVDARRWRSNLVIRALVPAALVTLALMVILLMGPILSAASRPNRTQWLATAQVVAAGGVLTLLAAWMILQEARHRQIQTFHQLARSRTAVLDDAFRDLEQVEIEGIARFYEGSEYVTTEEFEQYTGYLTSNPGVLTWAYAPSVAAAEQERFEQTVRMEGFTKFSIWERDTAGNRVPAGDRWRYFPVIRMMPKMGNQISIGFDMASEPVRRRALTEALETGLITASNPVSLLHGAGDQIGMIVFRPVFSHGQHRDPRGTGVVFAVVQPSALLLARDFDGAVFLELFLADDDQGPIRIASIGTARSDGAPTLRRPLFAFGKTFFVEAHAGPAFVRVQPRRSALRLLAVGLLLSGMIGAVVRMMTRHHQTLERTVEERTAELRRSAEEFRIIVTTQQDLMVKTDPEGRMLFVNPACCRLFDKTEAELIGSHWSPMVHPEDLPAVEAAVARLFAPPFVCAYEERALTPVGWRWLSWTAQAIRDPSGQVIALIGSGRDITEPKETESERTELYDEARRMNRLMGGREDRIIELKQEVNALSCKLGNGVVYPGVEAER